MKQKILINNPGKDNEKSENMEEELNQEIDPSKLGGGKLTPIDRLKGTCREYHRYANNDIFLNFIEKKIRPKKLSTQSCMAFFRAYA